MSKSHLVFVFAFIFTLFSISSSSQNLHSSSESINIRGSIKGAVNEKVALWDYTGALISEFQTDKDGFFFISLDLKEDSYMIASSQAIIPIYLKPGNNLYLNTTLSGFRSDSFWTGIGAPENNCLSELLVMGDKLGRRKYYFDYGEYPEKQFVETTDSVFKANLDILDNYKSKVSSRFYKIQYFDFIRNKSYTLQNYERYHGEKTEQPDFKVSSSFPNPYDEIDLNTSYLLNMDAYFLFVKGYLSSTFYNKSAHDFKGNLSEWENDNYKLQLLDKIADEKMGEDFKNRLLTKFAHYYYKKTKVINQLHNKVVGVSTSLGTRTELDKLYNKYIKLSKGMPAIDFTYLDENEISYKLNDFSGKVVYIDFYDKGCPYCVRALPNLRELEEELKDEDFQLVIISREDVESWKSSLKTDDFPGVNLNIRNLSDELFEFYRISSMPRYVLIDKEGNIIDGNAKRPDDVGLMDEIRSYL